MNPQEYCPDTRCPQCLADESTLTKCERCGYDMVCSNCGGCITCDGIENRMEVLQRV